MRTDEELNRLIAEWCGWFICHSFGSEMWSSPDPMRRLYTEDELPKYSTDLNAMHDVWKKSDAWTRTKWTMELADCVNKNPTDGFCLIFATARQRAEALVAVIEGEKK